MRRPRLHAAAAAISLLAVTAVAPLGQAAGKPDFSPYVEVSAEAIETGKTAGVVHNISGGPLRNIVIKVSHRWHWRDGGSHARTREVAVTELVLPGEFKGFASVVAPGRAVPTGARYSSSVEVVELTSVGLAPE